MALVASRALRLSCDVRLCNVSLNVSRDSTDYWNRAKQDGELSMDVLLTRERRRKLKGDGKQDKGMKRHQPVCLLLIDIFGQLYVDGVIRFRQSGITSPLYGRGQSIRSVDSK